MDDSHFGRREPSAEEPNIPADLGLPGKPSMARRKGDKYQDLWALRLALEHYTRGTDFEMYLEYELAQSLDDIVVVKKNDVAGYQVKWSADPNLALATRDFLMPGGRVYLGKLARGWRGLKTKYRRATVTSHLLSNTTLEDDIRRVLAGESLPVSFCAGRVRTWRKTLRTELGRASELSRAEQPHFLESLRLHLSQYGLVELEQYIQGELLDHRLGISDSTAYLKLAQLVEHHAVDVKAPITKDTVASIVGEYATKRRLPQRFAVDRGSFVRLAAFSEKLKKAVAQADGGYVVVTGPPGSGKSTSLSMFLDGLPSDRFAVARYYCFVDLNEYHQHRRLESETLLANLMSSLQEQFPDVLTRRFDYSPEHFTASLSTLGETMLARGKRLVVLVDGLDHVERADAELHHSVIDALPKVVPKGATFLLGTRELQRWPTFLQTGHTGNRPHLAIPLFGMSEVRDYLVGKHKLRLSAAQVRRAHLVSEGLPLYLRYIAERLRQTGDNDLELKRLPTIPGGEVDVYYREIWQQFERRGAGEARHLCIVLAALKFAASEDDLRELQNQLAAPAFSDAFGAVKHLLRERNGKHLIFHGSFGEFVFAQVSATERQSVYVDIHTWFKSRVGTPLWYSHSFWYAYAAKDYESLKRTVDLQFTDKAISDLCPERHLLAAIDLAADAARDTDDLVALARLGALKYRTAERWGQNIDCRLLARALSRLGSAEGLLRLVYDGNTDEWLQDTNHTLTILAELARNGTAKDGVAVFARWLRRHEGAKLKGKEDIVNYAAGLGAFVGDIRQGLGWSARVQTARSEMETEEPWAPGYAPAVEAYLGVLPDAMLAETASIIVGATSKERRQVLLYCLVKEMALRSHRMLPILLRRYLREFRPTNNPMLAFLGAVAGLQPRVVERTLGAAGVLGKAPAGYIPTSDSSLARFRLQCIAQSYAGLQETLTATEVSLLDDPSWYNGYRRYLLRLGRYVGLHLLSRPGSPDDALEGLDMLACLRTQKTEYLAESIMICRRELADSLFWLARAMAHDHPDRLPVFFQELKGLRTTAFWTRHWGIGEYSEDYSFELDIHQRLASIPECRSYVKALLDECAKSYNECLWLEGSTRSGHFLLLSSMAAQCGFSDAARGWLDDGLRHSLQYGDHKDVTLSFLIDTMKMLNRHEPPQALARCAEVMRMVDWMPNVTDNRETRGLPAEVFGAVVEADSTAAVKVLREYRRTKGRWQVLDCLQKLLESTHQADPEVLWALTSCFSNEGEDGQQKQVNARSTVIRHAEARGDETVVARLRSKLEHFIKTCIDPALWLRLQCEYWKSPDAGPTLSSVSPELDTAPKSYVLDGKTATPYEIEARLRRSIGEYLSTMKKLQEENSSFYSSYQWEHILQAHISSATRRVDLAPVEEYIDPKARYVDTRLSQELGKKLLEFGEMERGYAYLAKAYQYELDWWYWHWHRDTLAAVAQYDRKRAKSMAVLECHRRIRESEGYTVPPLAATAADVLGEADSLKTIHADFRDYCQEMFRSLPPKDSYGWMMIYHAGQDDFNRQAVEYLADELAEPEIDLGLRLIDVCRDLGLQLPELALPVFVENVCQSPPLAKSRLASILWLVASERPELMSPHLDKVSRLADDPHFQRKMVAVGILRLARRIAELPAKAAAQLASIESDYSARITYRAFRILTATPTPEFLTFCNESVLGSIRLQVDACCRVLGLDLDSVLAKVESSLSKAGWNCESARERVKEDWKGYVHPQDWPVVWPLKTCDLEIWDAFNGVLDEVASKSPLSDDQREGLWRVLHPGDPEWGRLAVSPRPADIAPLQATDKDAWLAELSQANETVARETLQAEWSPVYDQRVLSRILGNEGRLRSWLHISSALVDSGTVPTGARIEEECSRVGALRFADRYEAMTQQQARDLLTAVGSAHPRQFLPFIPLVAAKMNSPHYPGLSEICSLCGYMIGRYGLQFSGLDLLDGTTTVVRFENWQEGYANEAYSRDLVSFGTRLLVHKSLLQRIFTDLGVALCQTEHEERLYYGSLFKREPSALVSRTTYRIMTLD